MSAKIPYPLGTKQGENCGDKFDTSTNLCGKNYNIILDVL